MPTVQHVLGLKTKASAIVIRLRSKCPKKNWSLKGKFTEGDTIKIDQGEDTLKFVKEASAHVTLFSQRVGDITWNIQLLSRRAAGWHSGRNVVDLL